MFFALHYALKECLVDLVNEWEPATVAVGMEMNIMKILMCLIHKWGFQELLWYFFGSQNKFIDVFKHNKAI